MQFRTPRATTAERLTITPASGELIYDDTLAVVYYGDGVTVGGLEFSSGSAAISAYSIVLAGNGIAVSELPANTFTVSVSGAYAFISTVASVSAGLDTRIDVLEANPIPNIFRVEIADVSGGLQSQINLITTPRSLSATRSSYFRDDWMGTNIAGDTGSFANSLINGGGSSVSQNLVDANHFGIAFIQTGTNVAGACSVRHSNRNRVFGGGVVTYETLVNIDVVSDGTNTYGVRFGYGDLVSAAATDYSNGVYFEAPAATSPNWRFKTAKAGTRTDVDSGVAVVAGAWIRLGYRVNAAGTSVQFIVNGLDSGSPITTNIPIVPNTEAVALMYNIWKTAGTTNRIMSWDYVETGTTFTTPR